MRLLLIFCLLTDLAQAQVSLGIAALGNFSGSMVSYYVDATGGNDANTGLGAGAAWQTISNVNTKLTDGTIKPGNQVLFKSGEVFAGSLSVAVSGRSDAPIRFGSYGAGALPIINADSETYGITFTGSYLDFSSLVVTGATSTGIASVTGSKSNIVLRNCVSTLNAGGNIDLRSVNSLTISSCSSSNSVGYYGLELRGVTNATIKDIISINNDRDGLRVLSDGAVQSGNISIVGGAICGNGGVTMRNGVSIGADIGTGANVTVANVLCATNTGDGFNVHGAWTNVVFDHCISESNGTTGSGNDGDGWSYHETSNGTIQYCIGRDNKKTAIAHISSSSVTHYYNLFYCETNGALSNVLLTDTGIHTFLNNVIYSATNGGTGIECAGTVNLTNNVVVGFSTGIKKNTGSLNENADCLYGASTTNYSGFNLGPNSIQSNPLFLDAGARDFRLGASSPCISAGLPVGLSLDFAGKPVAALPSIGAYEQ